MSNPDIGERCTEVPGHYTLEVATARLAEIDRYIRLQNFPAETCPVCRSPTEIYGENHREARILALPRLTFASKFVGAILAGNKWATIRYDLEAAFEAGARVAFVSEEGRIFAVATITDRFKRTPRRIANRPIEGHEKYGSALEVVRSIGQYYPGASLFSDTELDVVKFDVNEEVDLRV